MAGANTITVNRKRRGPAKTCELVYIFHISQKNTTFDSKSPPCAITWQMLYFQNPCASINLLIRTAGIYSPLEESMTKSEFTDLLASKCRIGKSGAQRLLNSFLESIEDGLARDGKIALKGFGAFSVHRRPGRQFVNINTGERMDSPSENTVRFAASQNLKSLVNADKN